MDAGFIFNQPSSEALKRAYSNGGSTSASQNQNMSAPTSGGNNSVIQPFFDPHWLPQLIGPSPRGTPTFWDQPFGQVMPGGDATAGAFPQDKDYFSGATLSLDKISNAAPQPQVSSNSNPGDLSRKASSSDAPSADASSSHVPASYAGTKRQVATKASATTFDLTKRKNWAHHLMHVLPDFAHVLSFDGNITYASPSVHDLAGYEPSELVGQTFADLIHPEDQLAYLSQFKEVVAQPEAPPLFLYFRLRSKDGSYQLMELTGHARHEPTQQSTASGSAIPSDNKCFFGTARPYPSKNASMVDSFVEHKMENERLKARLARLTAEVGDIAPVEAQRVQMDSQFSKGSRTAVDDALNKTYNKSSAPQQTSTPNLTVSPQFTTLHAPIVRHNAAPPSSVSTLSRPEAAEPSAPSATTITDYSSAVPPANKKSKSRRPAADDNNYVCHDCGTADSPEWRRGPLGPKTLCNACGLRWAKKAKGPKPTRHSAAGTATH